MATCSFAVGAPFQHGVLFRGMGLALRQSQERLGRLRTAMIVCSQGRCRADSKVHDILGGLTLLARFKDGGTVNLIVLTCFLARS